MDESELLPIIIHEQSKTVKYNNTVENYWTLLLSHSLTYIKLINTERLKIPWKGTVLTRIISIYLTRIITRL